MTGLQWFLSVLFMVTHILYGISYFTTKHLNKWYRLTTKCTCHGCCVHKYCIYWFVMQKYGLSMLKNISLDDIINVVWEIWAEISTNLRFGGHLGSHLEFRGEGAFLLVASTLIWNQHVLKPLYAKVHAFCQKWTSLSHISLTITI